MVLSINTNVASMVALQNLNRTTSLLEQTQLRVSTGLRVNNAKEDAASFSIAQRMRSDVAGYEAVKIGLGLGDAALGVAQRAGEAISDLLIEMKAKAVQAQSGGLGSADRIALNDDVAKLIDQINTIVRTAVFNDVNLISGSAVGLNVLSSLDGSSTISVSAQSIDPETLGLGTGTGASFTQGTTVDLTTSANASLALTTFDNAISSVNTALAALGSTAKQVEIQMTFTQSLIDILNEGIGTMVDADMAMESARLQALQIKQQLGTQALAIANASPQSILSLFQ